LRIGHAQCSWRQQPIDRTAQKNTDYKNAAVQNVSVAPFFMANLGQFSGVVERPAL
jgi:hypothetical protein